MANEKSSCGCNSSSPTGTGNCTTEVIKTAGGGAAGGAAIGMALGGPSGAILGGLIGAAVGAAAASDSDHCKTKRCSCD